MDIDQSVITFCDKYKVNTPKNLIFLQLLMEGKMYKEIADYMKVGERAIHFRSGDILRKTGMYNRVDFMAAIYRIEKNRRGKR